VAKQLTAISFQANQSYSAREIRSNLVVSGTIQQGDHAAQDHHGHEGCEAKAEHRESLGWLCCRSRERRLLRRGQSRSLGLIRTFIPGQPEALLIAILESRTAFSRGALVIHLVIYDYREGRTLLDDVQRLQQAFGFK
jgi:hypothetical protein